MNEMVNLIVNNGAAIGCLIYFMFYNDRKMTVLIETIQGQTEAIMILKEAINNMD